MKKDLVATFPHIANYYVAFEVLFNYGFNIKTLTPPPITKKTLELGSKHSPDFVCSPFKYNLGNFIEALDKGANIIFQAGGACRYGYYAELQETILKDLGYDFKFINLPIGNNADLKEFLNIMKNMGIKLNFLRVIYYLLLCKKMVKKIDIFEDYLRKNVGFEEELGSFDKIHKEFLEKLRTVNSFKKLNKTYKKYYIQMKNIKLNKPDELLRVGVVGELYTIQDEFSNHFIERELAKKGVEITRFVTLDYLIFKKAQKEKKLLHKKNDYATHSLGAGGLDSIVKSIKFAEDDFDGIIHVKAFGCTPEINAMPILQRVSKDYKIPILYFSFDTATSETGVKTRVEAFYDMLEMRKSV